MAIHPLIKLPVSAEFLMLPVRHVSERATSADAFSAAVHFIADRANAATFDVPRLRWLKGVWAF